MDITIIASPFIGAILGYYTNKIAILMISQPYEPVFIFKHKVPLTPGLIPEYKKQIVLELYRYVRKHYLNGNNIKELSKFVVSKEVIYSVVSPLIDSFLQELANTNKLHNLASDISKTISNTIDRNISNITEKITDNNGDFSVVDKVIDNIFEVILQKWNISEDTAEHLTNKIMDSVLTPQNIKVILIKLLNNENITIINNLIKSNIKGGLGLILNFVNIQTYLNNLKKTLEQDSKETNQIIEKLLISFKLEQIIKDAIIEFKPQKLSWSNINNLKKYIKKLVKVYIKEYHAKFILPILQEIKLEEIVYDLVIKFDVTCLEEELIKNIKQEITDFIYNYLSDQLLSIIKKVIKDINIEKLIIDKVNEVPIYILDEITKKVALQRLHTIVILGGIIGFLIGCIQSILSVLF